MAAVLVERDGAIATVVLDRPDKLNALSLASWTELGERMRELSADDSLRCVIVRGAGTKAFAAGADIAEFPDVRANAAQGKDYGELIHATMRSIGECRHPTVAMIHGVCVGGGLEVALMCDLRICGAGSRFGIPINRLGLTMGYGELAGLLAVVGPAVALEILLEGRIFGAQEAFDKGLVQRVVADDQVEAEARAAARAHRRGRAAGRALAQAVHPALEPDARAVGRRLGRRATPASTRRTSARASPRFSPSASRGSGANDKHGTAFRTQGHRARAHHVGADRRHAARRHGRRRDQGRARARRRRHAALHAARSQRRVERIHDDEPQQAGHRARPEAPGGERGAAADHRPRRCRRRKLPGRHDGAAGVGLRRAAPIQSAADLLRALRLRPDRARCDQGRLRPGRAGAFRTDAHHRRSGRTADQGRLAGHRHQRRHPGRAWASSAPTSIC